MRFLSLLFWPSVVMASLLSYLLPPSSAMAVATPGLGRRSTARQAYEHLSRIDALAPYVREGGVAVVTGGNSGIGVETVRVLAGAGMTVHLCARNLSSAEAVREDLPEECRDRVIVQRLDLSDLSSVKEAAASLNDAGPIDCLVNNAGIMALMTRQESRDGIELQFATNHVGHHLLTRLLLPNMGPHARIVTVASSAHRFAKEPIEDWESKGSYTPWGAYGESKLGNILFAKQLQAELSGGASQRTAVSLHPGVIKSPLWKHALPSFLQGGVSLIANKSIEQGAATTVYCALARSVEGGAYYDDCAVAAPEPAAERESLRTSLWEYTERLLASKGVDLPKKVV